MIDFSGEDTPLFDFPVENENPVKNRFSGRFFGDLGIGLAYLFLAACGLVIAGCVASMVGIGAYTWWLALGQYPLWTTLITGATLLAYMGCVGLARRERIKNEQRR